MIPKLKKVEDRIFQKLEKEKEKLFSFFLLKKENAYFLPEHASTKYLAFKNKFPIFKLDPLENLSFSFYKELSEYFLRKKFLKKKEREKFQELLKDYICSFEKLIGFSFKDKNAYPYQKFISRFLFSVTDWACFLEQGLGKTKIIIDVIENFFIRENNLKILYLTPAFLTLSTYLEFKKWSSKSTFEKVNLISSDLNSREKEKILKSFFEEDKNKILIVSYEYLRYFFKEILNLPTSYKEFLKKFSSYFDILICDESHKLKNPNSQIHKYVRNLSSFCKRTYLLTGTPILNKIEDIYYQYRIRHYNFFNQSILDEEPVLEGKTFNILGKSISFVSSLEKEREKFVNEILKISAFILKKESIFELPEKEFIRVYVNMPKSVSEKYEKLYFDLLEDIEKYFDNKVKITSLFSKLTKLHELCQGFLYGENKSFSISNFKAKKLLEILSYLNEDINKISEEKQIKREIKVEIKDKKENKSGNDHSYAKEKRAIIFFKYEKDREILEEILKKHKIRYKVLTNISQKKLKETLENLEKDNIQVLLIQIHKGSHGLNLQDFSSNVIYYSYDFSFGNFSQSQDRIHRIGQDKTCRYFILLSHHPEIESLDEIIYKRLLKKKDISQEALLKDLKKKLIKEKEKLWKKGQNSPKKN